LPNTPQPPLHDIAQVINWVMDEGLEGTGFEQLLEQLCLRLVQAGVPLLRANFSMRAHHPEIGAFAYRWKRKDGIIHEQYQRSDNNATLLDDWLKSPLYHLTNSNDPELRHRIIPSEKPYKYPLFNELEQQGGTDYFANRLVFSDQSTRQPGNENAPAMGLLISWTSDGPDGFSDEDLQSLRDVTKPLGLALKSNSNYNMANDLLSAYLGEDAGGRVMSGDYARGSLENIEAVILYFDLQSFTKLSEALDGEDLIELLNDYFGIVVPIIEARGGNVLKFMGDGILAIFAKDKVPAAELTAIRTICDLRDAVAEINKRREKAGLTHTGFSIAVHAGEVLYGNIGSGKRLDFTVIGPAVNTTARFMSMCSNVDQTVIVGSNVAKPVMALRDDLVSLGQYRLRGVADRQELFTLD
jgi:adenylate cyclase